jgi:CHAD domain-containing protein
MVAVPYVAFVSLLSQQQYLKSPLNNNKGNDTNGNDGGKSQEDDVDDTVDHLIPYESYSNRQHRHFHRIVEKSHLTDLDLAINISSTDSAAFDVSTIPMSIKFGELASVMVPIYFQHTVDLCVATIVPSNNTSGSDGRNNPTSVMPDEVFVLRKTILKTRDLFDVFASVYPRKLRLLGQYKEGEQENDAEWGEKKMGKGKRHHERDESEEALHKMKKNHHSVVDIWKIVRRFLDDGYMLIGDFQDLSHANVMYSLDQLHQYQLQVWNWKEEFMAFVDQNHAGIFDYLSHACPSEMEKQEQEGSLASIISPSQLQRKGKEENEEEEGCSYVHSKSSHLFWGGVQSSQLPDGNIDEASTVLAKLGSAQLNRALIYLTQALAAEQIVGDVAVNEEVHEMYHNLRKEIRSFLDMEDLFGQLLFPSTSFEQHREDIALLKKTKKLLGDLNDEVVAYSKYVEWNEYPEEQTKLKSFISNDWGEFRAWAQEVDLNGKLHSLTDVMTNARE